MKPLVFLVFAVLPMLSAEAGEELHEPRKVAADAPARVAKLRTEIAVLDAQARGDSPEFEAELRAWEGKMAEPPEWSGHKGAKQAVPEKIAKILAIEPSERSDAQRTALVQYFRPRSKTVAAARKTAAVKRAELAALRRTLQ